MIETKLAQLIEAYLKRVGRPMPSSRLMDAEIVSPGLVPPASSPERKGIGQEKKSQSRM